MKRLTILSLLLVTSASAQTFPVLSITSGSAMLTDTNVQFHSFDTSSLVFSFSGAAALPGAARPGPIGQANFFEGTMTGPYRPATPGSDSNVTTWQYATAGSDGKSPGAAPGGVLASDPLVHAAAVTLPTYSRDWAVSWWDPNTGRIGDQTVVMVGPDGAYADSSGGPRVMAAYLPGSYPDDQWSEVTVGAPSHISAWQGPAVRVSSANGGSGFSGVYTFNGAWGIIYGLNGGHETAAAYNASAPQHNITVVPGDVFRLSIKGNVITFTQNGTALFKGTVVVGAQVITSGHPGIGVHGGMMPMKNWRAGSN